MKKEKRYTATYTIYIYARDDNHARSKAKMIANREHEKYPDQRCELDKLHETPLERKFEAAADDDLPF